MIGLSPHNEAITALSLKRTTDQLTLIETGETTMAKAPTNKTTVKNVFVDDENEIIPSAMVVSYWKDKFEKEYEGNGTLTASDEKIAEALNAVIGDESKGTEEQRKKLQLDRWDALLLLVEEVEYVTPSAIDSPMGRKAIELAERFGVEADNLVDLAVDQKEDYEGAPLKIADIIVPLFGGKLDNKDGTVLECDTILNEFPWPGSKQSEHPAGAASDRLFDRYEFTVVGKNEPQKGYFLGDFQKSTPHGKEIEERLSSIKLLRDAPTSEQIKFDYRTKFLVGGHIDPIAVKAEEDYWRGRRTSRINRIAKAIKYVKNAIRIQTELKEVYYTFVHDDKTLRYKANKPIKLLTGAGKKMVPYDKPLSLSQFTNLDVDKARELGGTMNNLTSTLKRTPGTEDKNKTNQGGGAALLEGPTADTVTKPEWIEAHMNNWNSAYIGETEEERKVASLNASKFMAYLNKQGKEGAERRATFRDYVDSLQTILAHYGKMLEQDAKDAAKAA
jgi:hypothetical protein